MKTILIIMYSNLGREPRVLRQVKALGNKYTIMTMGYAPLPVPENDRIVHYSINLPVKSSLVAKIQMIFQLIVKNYSDYYKRISDSERILSQNINQPDVIIAHDWIGLYLASVLRAHKKWESKIYFDSHECFTRYHYASLIRRFIMPPIVLNALKKCKDNIAVMSTVCNGIAQEYENFFKFTAGSVKVITNAPEYQDKIKPIELNKEKIRLIHHGAAIKIRKLDLIIKMMRYLDPEKYDLTFMLVPAQKRYYEYLVKISRKFKNIHFREPVETFKIPETINQYDIGLVLLKPIGFNNKYTLPNKLFEYIQARLAIACGPSPEVAHIVKKYELGACSRYFTSRSLAKTVALLTPEKIMEYKNNSDKYANELSAEKNLILIQEIIDNLTENNFRGRLQ